MVACECGEETFTTLSANTPFARMILKQLETVRSTLFRRDSDTTLPITPQLAYEGLPKVEQ